MSSPVPQDKTPAPEHKGHRHNNKKSTYQLPKILYFNAGDPSHYEKWRALLIQDTGKIFGELHTIFITNRLPIETPLPEPPNEPYDDMNDPGGIQREYIKQLISDKVKEDRKMKTDKPKLFSYLLSRISQPSLLQVQRRVVELTLEAQEQLHDDNGPEAETTYSIWNDFLAIADPVHLWDLIRNTHVNARTLSNRLDRQRAYNTYSFLKMHQNEKNESYI